MSLLNKGSVWGFRSGYDKRYFLFPFQKFRAARDVLVFYIGGHMFCYFDINDLSRVSMKCSEEEAILLREQYDWIGIDITRADDELIKRLIKGSLEIVGKKSITV